MKYIIFSLGCSLIAKGGLMSPEPMSWGTNALDASVMDIKNPNIYLKLFMTLVWVGNLFRIANIVVGIALFSWWPGAFLWLPITVVVGIFRPRRMDMVWHVVGFGLILVLVSVPLMLIH